MFAKWSEWTCPFCGAKMEFTEEGLECPQCFWRLRGDFLEQSGLPAPAEPKEDDLDIFLWG